MHQPAPDSRFVAESRSSFAGKQAPPARPRRGHRLRWAAGAVLALVLLATLPPLISANRYRNRLATAMSQSLGRPVHLDDVSLHLLPVPGFTLRNLVVSEDPAFGSEPIIRANTVEATLRASSLWRRPVEFSTIRFVEPSVNLVRDADGRWNLSPILLNASHVESAPTDQQKAGPKPRFPYIEATGGRVNLKLGPEKLPFSLTDADFALWLPSPRQWRVRLEGQPARTDSNITDPGRVRLEGELRRAEEEAAVPIDFRATWHNAPLGEATRILTGDDWGWRGSLNLDLALTGLLGKAHLASKLTLGGLRRGEFFPKRPLDVQIACDSQASLQPAVLSGLNCTLPDDAEQPLRIAADVISLQQPGAAPLRVRAEKVPLRWALLWAALFSGRVPTDLHPGGSVDVLLNRGEADAVSAEPSRRTAAQPSGDLSGGHPRTAAALPHAPAWTGSIALHLPPSGDAERGSTLLWKLQPAAPGNAGGTGNTDASAAFPPLRLAPTAIPLAEGEVVTLGGTLGQTGYTLSVNGNASAAAILEPARYLPQLGDGLEHVLPYPPTTLQPSHVQFTCIHPWNAATTCTGLQTQPAAPTAGTGAAAVAARQQRQGSVLVPRNLSPFAAPPSTPATSPPPR